MKGCLRFGTFICLISPKLAKYIHELSALEQHQRIDKKREKKKKNTKGNEMGIRKKGY
jgi:hypothetical protein